MFKLYSEWLKNQHSKWIFLILLVLTVSVIAYFRVKIQMDLGPIFDTYDFLADAAGFAGKGIGYSDFTRPPFLSLLTSIFFVFDGLSVAPIFIVDGLLYIFGCIGLYLFLKTHFDSMTSFIGSLLFATFPIIISYAGAGFNDVSSVSVAIWAMYLTYLAVKKDSRFFYLSFPVALMAFLTRYNMALIIFPIFLYILINRKQIKHPRNILMGIGISSLVIIPIFLFFNWKFGNPIFPFLDFFTTSGGAGNTEHFAYNPDPLYYVKDMPSDIGAASLVVIFLTLLGFVVRIFRIFRGPSEHAKGIVILKKVFRNSKFLIMFLLLFVFLISFDKVHYMVSEIIFFIICYLAYLVSSDFLVDVDKDLLFLSWFMAFLIFQSVYVAKDHRYFITMAAPLAYFLARGFSWATEELKVKFKDRNLTPYLFAVLLTVMMLLSVSAQLQGIEKDNQNAKLFNQDAQAASYWLMNHDPTYKSKVIYADLWSYYGWFLQTNVGKMPFIRNNQTTYVGPKDYNFTEQDKVAYNQELERLHPYYYISAFTGMNFTSYQPIKKFGTVTIYQRI